MLKLNSPHSQLLRAGLLPFCGSFVCQRPKARAGALAGSWPDNLQPLPQQWQGRPYNLQPQQRLILGAALMCGEVFLLHCKSSRIMVYIGDPGTLGPGPH